MNNQSHMSLTNFEELKKQMEAKTLLLNDA
jgi:hypothetical protein